MAQEFSSADLAKLAELASKRLNTTPEHLKEVFERGGFAALANESGGVSTDQARQFQQIAADPQKASEFLNSPSVRALMERLLQGG